MKSLVIVPRWAGVLVAAAWLVPACSSDNQPSGSGGGGGSSSSGGTPATGSSSGGAGSSSSSGGQASSSGGGSASDAGDDGGMPLCPSGLQDKITACTAATPTCVKGCGPDLATGVNGNLGQKTCACNTGTMVYNCQPCAYPSPLPSCYAPSSTTPPACAAGVADKTACTTPCSGVCTLQSDAGKTQGCVCVMLASGTSQWTCATQWW